MATGKVEEIGPFNSTASILSLWKKDSRSQKDSGE
jgi:hypothetical protein